ncbi:MAG TPA: DUF418 domain-containing protein [Thermoanaerobaculia bacterium]|jgi:uncharacterized protein
MADDLQESTAEGLLAPAVGQERYGFLDALRGFSLLGIILANMISLSLYLYLPTAAKATFATASTDKVVDFVELVLIESKFYTIFSVLFGVGFSILITRARAKSIVFDRFFLRRMLFLFLIGLAHAVLFWHNDILEAYALCGVLLLPLARARNRTILTCAAVALLAPLVVELTKAIPAGTFTGPRDLLFARFGVTAAERVPMWAEGGFADILLVNAGSWFGQVDYVITSGMMFKIYGCFLLGLYIGRSELYKRLDLHRLAIKRIAILGLVVGLPLNVIYARTFEAESWLHKLIATFGIIPLSAAYVCLFAWLWLHSDGARLARIFEPVGRLALTNYVVQSVISMFIFRGVGLGLGGKIGPTLYIPIGLAIYVLQLVASRAWLRRFQFGPVEWLWRMLTYGARVPLRKQPRVLVQPAA